mmetsp:Transcript_87970/g.247174  ORF Transcript_87970/g.247174 Transcript_87970/m.247174 type:complete len:303 (+) Transcript_87970:1016-1924(+)
MRRVEGRGVQNHVRLLGVQRTMRLVGDKAAVKTLTVLRHETAGHREDVPLALAVGAGRGDEAPLPEAGQRVSDLSDATDHDVHCRVLRTWNVAEQRGFPAALRAGALVDEDGPEPRRLAGPDVLHGVLEHHGLLRPRPDGAEHLEEGLSLRFASGKHVLHAKDAVVREELPDAQGVEAAERVLAGRVRERDEGQARVVAQAAERVDEGRVRREVTLVVAMLRPEVAELLLDEGLGQPALCGGDVEALHRGVEAREVLVSELFRLLGRRETELLNHKPRDDGAVAVVGEAGAHRVHRVVDVED